MFKKFFQKLTESKNPESKRYRMQMARRICGHHIKYVTERKDDVEEVIGRSGGLNIRGDELLVFASGQVLLRCKIAQMQAEGQDMQSALEILEVTPDEEVE